MPTTDQKAHILMKAGIAVPAFPAWRLPVQERHLYKGNRAPQQELDAGAEQAEAVAQWERQIDNLFVTYAAARAAKSLRESEEAQQLGQLQRANAQLSQSDPRRSREQE